LEIARRAYDETIMLAVDGVDALQPGVRTIAAALFDAASTMSDAELEQCLGRWPGDAAALVPALRRRLPDLPPALVGTEDERSVREREALVSWIEGMSQRAPVLLVLDDVHRAGPELLFLLGGLLTSTDPVRVLVLATARSGPDHSSSRLEQLVHRVDEDARVDRIELDGLSLTSVQRLLAESGVPESDVDAAELVAVTQGRPDLLAERLRGYVTTRS
jgi:predicted ATPase